MRSKQETVLIIDDERFNINVLVDLLTPDYNTIVAKNGEQALKRLESDILPDIILLDILMPGMDGYEVCSHIKQDPRTENIPVIFISALDRNHDEEKGLELGAVDYIAKPFSPFLVKLRVKNHLRLKRQNDLLMEMANLDGLTGIYNRRHFNEQLTHEWDISTRYRSPLSLIMMDIDYFKRFNDHYGHLSGDDCLSRVARALSRVASRPMDLVARYGGEEFVCLLPNSGIEGAKMVGESLRLSVTALTIPHKRSKVTAHVTISLGAASMVAKQEIDPAVLIELADKNLYGAKKLGRNRLVSESAPGEV